MREKAKEKKKKSSFTKAADKEEKAQCNHVSLMVRIRYTLSEIPNKLKPYIIARAFDIYICIPSDPEIIKLIQRHVTLILYHDDAQPCSTNSQT